MAEIYNEPHYGRSSQSGQQPLAMNTGSAAVTWLDEGSGAQQTRVYYQNGNGDIMEQMCESGRWSPGNGGQPITRARSGSPLTVNYYYREGEGGRQLRLYFIAEYGALQEMCYSDNRGWFEGQTLVQ